MNVNTLGIDIAKSVFHLHGVDSKGKTQLTRKLTRKNFVPFVANLSPCLILMEACGSSNHWGRVFREMGHEAKLISPQFVKPFLKGNKNDYNDAEAICEAGQRPNMRFVPIKEIEQQDIQALHRVRSRIMRDRTAVANQTRGLLAEYGIVCSRRIYNLRNFLPQVLEDAENGLTDRARELFSDLYDELINLDDQIKKYDIKVAQINQNNEQCLRVSAIEGVGNLTATAMVAAVGDARTFKNGRQMSAWLGLVPRQHSTGGKANLGKMSKRGDRYLRTLLIHGARSTVYAAKKKTDSRSRWINKLVERRGFNVTCVAVANKNARIMWALMSKEENYRPAA